MQNINVVATAISMGASFVARGFSGGRRQLVPLIKAGIAHRGCAVLDVISPCVTFNDHKGSTKSYAHLRENFHSVMETDFVPPAEEITASYDGGTSIPVKLHDGSTIVLRKTDPDYDPTRRAEALGFLEEHRRRGEVVTGLLFLDETLPEMHDISGTAAEPLMKMPYEDLNPGSDALARLQQRMR
jgi:2-oxoglutarate ferredoxin oxidoreductase subunit beta